MKKSIRKIERRTRGRDTDGCTFDLTTLQLGTINAVAELAEQGNDTLDGKGAWGEAANDEMFEVRGISR